ncbi:MAG: 2-dehydropantoate 2-reductase [Bacteroidales bacterium]|nr:2-dehydropantoate 2-reductase [Bacteroidales bacterium]
MSKRRYAVIGTGGIGGYYGGRLALCGQEVHFLLRSDYETVKREGLQVDSVNGDFHLFPVHAYADTRDMPPCDVVLVCMKTTGNDRLGEMLPPLLHQGSLVVLIQNGLNMEQELSAALPGVAIAAATAFICTFKVGAGHIRHAAYGDLSLAPFQAEAAALLPALIEDLRQAGIGVHDEPDAHLLRWKKLVWNIPYNGLTVALDATTAELTFQKDSRRLVVGLMQEVVAAAACCGAEIPDSFIDRMIALTEEMTPYAPSMKLDYDAGRPMEIRTMYLLPIEEARRAGFEMKQVQMLADLLLFMQERRLSGK